MRLLFPRLESSLKFRGREGVFRGGRVLSQEVTLRECDRSRQSRLALNQTLCYQLHLVFSAIPCSQPPSSLEIAPYHSPGNSCLPFPKELRARPRTLD